MSSVRTTEYGWIDYDQSDRIEFVSDSELLEYYSDNKEPDAG